LDDLRSAFRQLAKSPGFTAIALLTLALGIGACAAIFSVVNSVLLRPPPFPQPDRVVTARETLLPAVPDSPVSSGVFYAWQKQASSFERMGALTSATYNLTGEGEPVRVTAMRMTASTLPTFGMTPALGRNFSADEDAPGTDNVAILSHGLWRRHFGGRPDVLQRDVYLNGRAFTVVGVMPSDSPFPERWELFTPYAPTASNRENLGFSRQNYVYARLKPGATIAQAQAELTALGERLAERNPQMRGWGVRLFPVMESSVGEVRPILLSLLGAVGLLLLIACANVASLLLARAISRGKEMAVRAAVGASRARLVRQLLVESVCLALAGGALGVLIAQLGLEALLALAPDTLPRAGGIAVDGRVLALTATLALLTGIAFGMVPALSASRVQLHDTLKESGRGASEGARRQRLRSTLVVAEVAVALVLLAGAGLLMRSFARLQQQDPGFRPDGAMTAHIHLPRPKYRTAQQYVAVADATINRLAALPGVQVVAASHHLPFTFPEYLINRGFEIVGRPLPAGADTPTARTTGITPDFFQALGIPLQRGRAFGAQDTPQSQPVAIINEHMARRYFPGEDPLGKQLRLNIGDGRGREIVGVVGDVKADRLDGGTTAQIYLPFAVAPDNDIFFVVRAPGSLAGLPGAFRAAVSNVDPELPIAYLRPLADWVDLSVARQRYAMTLFGVFAAVALLLAAIGIYGVMSYSVSQRTGELGLRMALGANGGNIVRLVLARGGRLIAVGLLAGLAGALLLTRLIDSMLFGIRSYDPLTFAVILAVLAAVGILACLLPARRAANVDPLTALRAD
jgi:putative ABC transport system permease protein